MTFLIHLTLAAVVIFISWRCLDAYDRAQTFQRIERAGRTEMARHDARTSQALLEIERIDRETHHRLEALRRQGVER